MFGTAMGGDLSSEPTAEANELMTAIAGVTVAALPDFTLLSMLPLARFGKGETRWTMLWIECSRRVLVPRKGLRGVLICVENVLKFFQGALQTLPRHSEARQWSQRHERDLGSRPLPSSPPACLPPPLPGGSPLPRTAVPAATSTWSAGESRRSSQRGGARGRASNKEGGRQPGRVREGLWTCLTS